MATTEVVGTGRPEIPTRVLVLGMAGEDGTIVGEDLYPVAEACGQSAEQVRSCLRRLVAEGQFVRDGSGRLACWHATESGRRSLDARLARTRLAYRQDAVGRGWDGKWRLVAFAVPETRRVERDAFRDRLRAMGGAALQGGLYVSPNPWHEEVSALAARSGMTDLVTLASTSDLEIGGERDPRRLTRRLWRLDELAERYEAFITEFRAVPEVLSSMRARRERLQDADFLPGALGMAVSFIACFNDDPLLPPELLPRPWPGRAARDLAVRCRRLALAIRRAPGRPALFRAFDEVVDTIA
ncbi:MAG: PaaX family transcriptional regulator C-terminal domain-containing protein [Acidimicrobiales bacterium]